MNDKVEVREFEAVIYRVDGKLDDLNEKFDNLIDNQNKLVDAVNNSVNNQIGLEKDQYHIIKKQAEISDNVINLIKNYKPTWESSKKLRKNAGVISMAAIITLAGLITGSAYVYLTDKPTTPEAKKVQLVKE